MPLLSDDIVAARVAYSALESRAVAAEGLAEVLQTHVAVLGAAGRTNVTERRILGDHFLAAVARNVELEVQLVPKRADASLVEFISHLGVSAALAESAMPDRAIPSVTTSVQAWLVIDGDRLGLRFAQPETGTAALAKTTIEIVKVPNTGGPEAPRLFTTLQNKLAVYATPELAAIPAARDVIVAVAGAIGAIELWSFGFVVALGRRIGTSEKAVATTLRATKPGPRVDGYERAADALSATAAQLAARATPVAADIETLAAALEATNAAASAVG
jgi:hypothetical protein